MDQPGRAFHHSVHSESAIRLLFSKQPDYGRAYPQVLSKYSMHTMATQAAKRVLVVAGLGNESGTGAGTARLFAKKGLNVALIVTHAVG